MVIHTLMVCPVLKTREMLYRGGFVADQEGDDKMVTIDGKEMIFDDAPVIIGIGSFRETRRGMYEGGDEIGDGSQTRQDDDDEADRLAIMKHAHTAAIRKSIRDIYENGGTTIPDKAGIIEGYKKRGGGDLRKIEALARDDVNEYHRTARLARR